MTDIATYRLLNQQIIVTRFKTAKEVVAWMGAMQAQDYPMAKWAVGVRLPNSTDKLIEEAFNDGEILRTHLMRPTWHFVSADDIYWMLELTAPRIISSMKFREKWLGITSAVVTESDRVIEKALSPDKHLTREELIAEMNKAKVRADGYRSGHLLMRAELDGLICSGKVRGTKQTYTLIKKRVPRKKMLSREESLKELSRRYFSSRGPAMVSDFARWSGLSMADAKNGMEMTRSELASEIINGNTFWSLDSFSVPPKLGSVLMLPAFDEFLIAYKDRSAALDHGIEERLISQNGLFRPTIVIDGKVTGLWRRVKDGGNLVVETRLFRAHSRKERAEIKKAAERFGEFLGVRTVDCKI